MTFGSMSSSACGINFLINSCISWKIGAESDPRTESTGCVYAVGILGRKMPLPQCRCFHFEEGVDICHRQVKSIRRQMLIENRTVIRSYDPGEKCVNCPILSPHS